MLGDIQVENLTTIVTDHKETVEYAEPERWNREKIHRGDRLPMIPQEGKPKLGSF